MAVTLTGQLIAVNTIVIALMGTTGIRVGAHASLINKIYVLHLWLGTNKKEQSGAGL